MNRLHIKLTQKYQFYHNWHQTKHHNEVHWGIFIACALLAFSLVVSAYDAAGNESVKSAAVSATTQVAPLTSNIYKCNPTSDVATNYKWDPINFTIMADGKLAPDSASWSKVIPNQENQIALDTFRNKKIAFVSGVTFEAPAGTENYTVVPVTNCPPAVWGGNLVYDHVNKEAVLIGGTSSIIGGTEGTWVYSPQLADWYKLDPSSSQVKQVRSNTQKIKADLNNLRWDLWKAIEYKISGRTSTVKTPAILKSSLDSIKADLQTNLNLANSSQLQVSLAYEKSQLQGAATWIQDAINKLSTTGADLNTGIPENMEKDYRAMVDAYTSIENTEDSLLEGPQPRYFSIVAYDFSQNVITVNGGKHDSHTWSDGWIYLTRQHRWERKNPLPGVATAASKINVIASTGDSVLRDAYSALDLKNYKSSMDSWISSVPSNTWVKVPTNGTGRPNWGRSWSSIIYDPERQQIYYRDGGHGSYHGAVTDHYDIPTGRWFRGAQIEVPDGAIMGTYFGWGRSYNFSPWAIHTYKYGLFYNPLIKQLQRVDIKSPYILYNSNGVPVNEYNPDTGLWNKDLSYIPPGDDPSITGSPFISPLVPGVPDGLIGVHAYDRYNPRSTSYLWYKNASGIKTWADAGPLPFPHEDHHSSFFFDPLRKRAMYYGGKDTERDVFVFDTTSPTSKWVKLNATVFGGASLPYPSREVVYLPKYDIFLFLEGWKDTYSDSRPPVIWSFDPKKNEFRKIDLSVGSEVTALPSAGVSSGLAYDPVSDLVFYITAANSSPTMFAFRYGSSVSNTTPPSSPLNFTATAVSSSQINLSWAASADDVGVAGYKIYRDGTLLKNSVDVSYSDIDLSASTTYSYAVSAYDAAGNESAKSVVASATTSAPLAPGLLNIPLTIQEVLPQGIIGISRTSEPVTVGIPLAEDSGITNINQLGLTGVSAGQFRALAHWPNGNIKWALTDFQASIAAGSQNTSVSLTSGTGNFGGSNLASDSGALITVNTGLAQFTIKKSNFNVFDKVIVNGQTLVNSGNNGRVLMRDQNDVEFSSINDSLSTAVIEENGPVKTVIKATGSFKNTAGIRLMDYTLRMSFYKNKSQVKTSVVLRNASKAYPSHVLFNSAEVIVPMNIGASKSVEFAKKVGTASQNISPSETAYMYQAYSTDRLGYDTKGCTGSAYGWNPPVPGTCDANGQYVFDPAQSGLKIQVGQTALNTLGNQDDWTQGYAKLYDSANVGISTSYRYMSSYWPAGFEFKGNGESSIELFSKQNTKKSLKFAFGAHETREIMWDFFTAVNDPKKTLYDLQYPLVARAPFSHYMDTKAIYGQSEFVTPEQQNKFFSDIGRPDLSPVLANPPFNRLFRFWSWRAGGGMNQTDFPLNDLQDFLRTGFGGYYLWGEQRTLYNSDNAVSHSDDFSTETNFTISDPANTIEAMNGDTFDMEHAHMLSIPFYYYLTGNEQMKETVLDYGEFLDRSEITGNYGLLTTPYFRAWLRKYRNFAIVYEFGCYTQTCNNRYKNYIENASNYLLDSRDNPSSGTLYPRGRNLERGYIYWDTEASNNLGYRMFGSLDRVQMTTEAIWQAIRIMGDTNWNYARKEEMEDTLLGLDQFLFNEAYVEFNGGDAIGEFGFHYFYPLDKSYTPTTVDTTPYDGSRAALYAYKRTGDTSFLIKAKKLSWAITEYATNRSPSELQDQALMYIHFNPPTKIWKTIPISVQNNGGGSYTLTWTVPQDAAGYQIKYSNKSIVDWLGFDKATRIYQYDPAQYTAFFAASNITNEPAPLAFGQTQSFNLSGLSCGTSCYFAIKYLTGSVATPDTTPPSIPANLQATAVSSSQINLSWIASTDDVGVTGYKIYRCAGTGCAPTVQIATSSTNSYSNTGLTASTTYTYTVSAYDAAGNESEKTTPLSATTLSSFKQADFNKDGVVNQLDFDILKQDFNRTDKPKSDLNQDGIVDSRDLGILMSEWSK